MKVKETIPNFENLEERHLLEQFDKGSDFIQVLYKILINFGLKPYKYTVVDTTKEKEFIPLSLAVHYEPNGRHNVRLLHETGDIMKLQTESWGFVIYLLDAYKNYIFICPEQEHDFFRKRYHYDIEDRRTVAIHVYRNNEPLNISTYKPDMRFPDFQDIPEINATNIMSVPMSDFKNENIGIFEMFRNNCMKYNELEFQRFQFLAKWMAECMQRNKTEVIYKRFNEITNILSKNLQNNFGKKYQKHNDDFLNSIVRTAKLTFDAQSASIFLTNDQEELYKEVTTESLSELKSSNIKLRLGKELQLAKVTADSNAIINYQDVYNDARFDNKIDIKTGKIIRSVLATPIRFNNTKKSGVIQVINKINEDFFTNIDEEFMKIFDDYTSLWLRYKWACQEIDNLRILSNILKEMIFQQWQKEDDISYKFSIDETIYMPNNFLSFDYLPNDNIVDIPKFIYYMILVTCKEMFASNRLALYCFVNIVKKCYAQLNSLNRFNYVFMIVHFVFVFLKRYDYEHTYEVIPEAEKFSLLVAALCCFIDCDSKLGKQISGKRKYLVELYGKCAMERHQFWITKLLIMSSGLLNNLPIKEQNDIFKMIEEYNVSLNMQTIAHQVLTHRILTNSNIYEKNSKQFIKNNIIRAAMIAFTLKKYPLNFQIYRKYVESIHVMKTEIDEKETLEDSLVLITAVVKLFGACLEVLCQHFSFLNSVLTSFRNFCEAMVKMKVEDLQEY